jgi:hypothetical protein
MLSERDNPLHDLLCSGSFRGHTNDFISIQGVQDDVDAPQTNTNTCGNVFRNYRPTQLTTNDYSAQQQNCEDAQRAAQENYYGELEITGRDVRIFSCLDKLVDGSYHPRETHAQKDIHSVGPSDISYSSVGIFGILSGGLTSKGVRKGCSQSN